MILQQNSVLEKKITELEAEKERLEKDLKDIDSKRLETSKALEKNLEELKAKVKELETELKEKEKEISVANVR